MVLKRYMENITREFSYSNYHLTKIPHNISTMKKPYKPFGKLNRMPEIPILDSGLTLKASSLKQN